MAGDAKMYAERDMALLRERAARVAAFKARVQIAGMTRPGRAPEERAFLERQGVALPFKEVGAPAAGRWPPEGAGRQRAGPRPAPLISPSRRRG